METTVDITTQNTYSVADTGLNKAGLFARVSAKQASHKVSGGCKKLVTRFTRNDF